LIKCPKQHDMSITLFNLLSPPCLSEDNILMIPRPGQLAVGMFILSQLKPYILILWLGGHKGLYLYAMGLNPKDSLEDAHFALVIPAIHRAQTGGKEIFYFPITLINFSLTIYLAIY
ncbi:hypothetical protein ACJX0J_005543, partial [Zea mays]